MRNGRIRAAETIHCACAWHSAQREEKHQHKGSSAKEPPGHCADCPVKYSRRRHVQRIARESRSAHVEARRKTDQNDQKDDGKEGYHEHQLQESVDSDSTGSVGGVAGSRKGA